jgi:hypothetical protein
MFKHQFQTSPPTGDSSDTISHGGFCHPARHFEVPPILWGISFLVKLGLLLLPIIIIGKLVRCWAWHMADGSKGKLRHPHGPVPPWFRHWDEQAAQETEAKAETGDTKV